MTTESTDRRNHIIRTVAALTGDAAVGIGLAALCAWVIHAAALGFFLSFLSWLVMALISLLVSQHLVHPLVNFALSDTKLDTAIDTVSDVCDALCLTGSAVTRAAINSIRRTVAGATA